MEAEKQTRDKTVDFKSHHYPIESFVELLSAEGHRLHTYRFPASDRPAD